MEERKNMTPQEATEKVKDFLNNEVIKALCFTNELISEAGTDKLDDSTKESLIRLACVIEETSKKYCEDYQFDHQMTILFANCSDDIDLNIARTKYHYQMSVLKRASLQDRFIKNLFECYDNI